MTAVTKQDILQALYSSAERVEDMSVHGKLRLIQQPDGDIIVIVEPDLTSGGESNYSYASVEFCASGGKSPKTLAALRQLMQAMAEDDDKYRLTAAKEST